MRTFVVASCLLAVAVAQFPPARPGLKETQHFQAISQPHLPQDTNVLHATRQFLDKFAELKALADAAPDPAPARAQHQQQFAPAPQQQFAPAPHRFSAPQQAPRPAPQHGAIKDFDVNAEIGSLLTRHHALNPTPAPAPAPRRAQPVQVQRAPAFPTFNVHNNQAGHRPQVQPRPQPQPQFQPRPQPQFVQAAVRPVDPNVATHNSEGLLVNPERFPGPLAHSVPAGVSGRVEHTQFTPEVAAAHRALASAHANILQQQAKLPRRL